MPRLFADAALLPAGWSADVLLEWNDDGILTRVEAGAGAGSCERAQGPVLPGMPNVHSHAFQRAMAGLAEFRGHPVDDFWTWREAMYALVERLGPDDVEAIAAQLYVEMLRHGYTSVAEFHYLHHAPGGRRYDDPAELAGRIVAASREAGIALTLLPVLYALGGIRRESLSPAQKRFESDPEWISLLVHEIGRRWLPDPDLRLGVAPHSVRAVDAMMLQEIVAATDGLDASMPIHMHVSEQAREVEECLATHGATPFAWIADLVRIDRRWSLIHGTHLTPSEREAAAKAGACVGLCPTTEANLGDGIFDFRSWLGGGAAWGIGGDSHVGLSPFEELRLLEYGQRLRHGARNIAASGERPHVATNLWAGAASGGAQSLGQALGCLAPGRRADLVVLDRTNIDFEHLEPDAILAVSMFCGGANRVRDVFVRGRACIRNGHHEREGSIERRFRAALARLRARP